MTDNISLKKSPAEKWASAVAELVEEVKKKKEKKIIVSYIDPFIYSNI